MEIPDTSGNTTFTAHMVRARALGANGNHSSAIRNYLLALQTEPALGGNNSFAEEFAEAFTADCDALSEDRTRWASNENCSCGRRALEVLPPSTDVFSDVGNILFRTGDLEHAKICFQEAVFFNYENYSAIENLDNILSLLVDRWHFQMLNDSARNIAFKNAISKAVNAGNKRVLDIGCGTGILSMMAGDAGALNVFACDESKSMCLLTCKMLDAHKMKKRVRVRAKHSVDLVVGQQNVDLGRKVNLIVTETIDCGLFGERILSTLSHAWKNLVDKAEKPLVIPGRAELFCSLIESEEIRKHHRCRRPFFKHIDLSDFEFVDVTSQPKECLPDPEIFDPYTTYNLGNLRGGYTRLTGVHKCLDVNFNDEKEIDHLLAGHKSLIEFTVRRKGEFDAVALWFKLYVDEDNIITSDPDGPPSCWRPAIIPVTDSNTRLTLNESVTIEIIVVDNHLQVKILNICPANRSKTISANALDSRGVSQSGESSATENLLHPAHSTSPNFEHTVRSSTERQNSSDVQMSDNTAALSDNLKSIDLQPSVTTSRNDQTFVEDENSDVNAVKANTNSVCHCPCGYAKSKDSIIKKVGRFYLCDDEVYRLNDSLYNDSMLMAVESLKSSRSAQNLSGFTILEMTSLFSVLPIQVSRMGASSYYWLGGSDHHNEIYSKICEKNGVVKGAILPDADSSAGLNLDCVFCDLVAPDGMLRQHVLNDLAYIRLASLNQRDGCVIPGTIHIYGVCVSSEELMLSSLIVGGAERTCGYRVADFLNEFQTQSHRDIDLHTLKYTLLTYATKLLTVDLNSAQADLVGLPQFLNCEEIVREPAIQEERSKPTEVDAIIYWFVLELHGKVKISTLDQRTHWRQSAAMISGAESVSPGDFLLITTRIVDGRLNITVECEE